MFYQWWIVYGQVYILGQNVAGKNHYILILYRYLKTEMNLISVYHPICTHTACNTKELGIDTYVHTFEYQTRFRRKQSKCLSKLFPKRTYSHFHTAINTVNNQLANH